VKRILVHVTLFLVIACFLGGCASLGIRPSEPSFMIKTEDNQPITNTACAEYVAYANYSQELQEAYLSRASQNRFWIYAAGTTALATIATTAGLAAAAAPSAGTLAVVSLSGGFLSGMFAVADNPALADIYTIATKNISISRADADSELALTDNGSRFEDNKACAAALKKLRAGVTQARNDLERARTDSAAGALQRAAAQTKHLNDLADQIKKDQSEAQAVRNGVIMSIEPDTITNTAGFTGTAVEITLTAYGLTPSICAENIKVSIGDKKPIDGTCTPLDDRAAIYVVKFKAPAKPPFPKQTEYSPVVLIGTTEKKVETRAGVILKYR
jgi:hypothetical protein